MGHAVTLFAGPVRPLRAIQAVAGMARIYSLTPGAPILVLPLDDEVHDALHRRYGTGEWPDTGASLTSTDRAFCARVSAGSALAYLATDYFGGAGEQSAMLWQNGMSTLGPSRLDTAKARGRPPNLWPINAALRGLGIEARSGEDEFQSFGLERFRSNAAIAETAFDIDRHR